MAFAKTNHGLTAWTTTTLSQYEVTQSTTSPVATRDIATMASEASKLVAWIAIIIINVTGELYICAYHFLMFKIMFPWERMKQVLVALCSCDWQGGCNVHLRYESIFYFPVMCDQGAYTAICWDPVTPIHFFNCRIPINVRPTCTASAVCILPVSARSKQGLTPLICWHYKCHMSAARRNILEVDVFISVSENRS